LFIFSSHNDEFRWRDTAGPPRDSRGENGTYREFVANPPLAAGTAFLCFSSGYIGSR
jgi:hypothetical protein